MTPVNLASFKTGGEGAVLLKENLGEEEEEGNTFQTERTLL